MIDTVIFDLDGLLADTEPNWYRVMNRFLGDYGCSMTLECYVDHYMGKTVTDNVKKMIKDYNLSEDLDTGIKNVIAYEEDFVEQGVALKAGALELLEYLKEYHYKIVLGTSSKKDRAIKILKWNKVDAYFDEIVVGYEVERSKPFPDVFLAAASRAKSKPSDCLVLEDSDAGIQAAYSAGIKVICIPDMKNPEKEFASKTEAILPSLIDVIEYLKSLRKQW